MIPSAPSTISVFRSSIVTCNGWIQADGKDCGPLAIVCVVVTSMLFSPVWNYSILGFSFVKMCGNLVSVFAEFKMCLFLTSSPCFPSLSTTRCLPEQPITNFLETTDYLVISHLGYSLLYVGADSECLALLEKPFTVVEMLCSSSKISYLLLTARNTRLLIDELSRFLVAWTTNHNFSWNDGLVISHL